jgi:hypothetical protein
MNEEQKSFAGIIEENMTWSKMSQRN